MGERSTSTRGAGAGLFLASLLLAAVSATALRFELESGFTKCISEDIKLHEVAVGKYSLASLSDHVPLPDSHRVSVKVALPLLS